MTPEELAAARQEFARQVEFCKKARAKHKNIVVEIFQERIEEMAEIANQALDALEAQQQAVEQAKQEARVQALGEAAMNVCGTCSQSKFPFFEATYSCYSHEWFNARGVRNVETCLATNIWELRAKETAEQGQGEGKEGERGL